MTVPPDATAARGIFIAFEGGDGSGKSTQVRLLADRLRQEGQDVLLTREPGGTDVGERLRSLVLDPEHAPIDAVTEALIFAASRSAHVRQLITPALAAGRTVLTDRYVDSSVAYQGAGRALGADTVAGINEWATGGLQPDLTVLLDVDTATASTRRAARAQTPGGTGPDRMESEPEAFHQSIRTAFTDRAAAHPERYLVLDAGREVPALAAEIWARTTAVLHGQLGTGLGAGAAPTEEPTEEATP